MTDKIILTALAVLCLIILVWKLMRRASGAEPDDGDAVEPQNEPEQRARKKLSKSTVALIVCASLCLLVVIHMVIMTTIESTAEAARLRAEASAEPDIYETDELVAAREVLGIADDMLAGTLPADEAKSALDALAPYPDDPLGMMMSLVQSTVTAQASGVDVHDSIVTARDTLAQELEHHADLSEPDAPSAPQTAAVSEEQRALATALDYLRWGHFSRSGLIEQLEYEGFTDTQATYAVDNCGADWSEQALGSALDYLDSMGFSESGLKEQLVYDGFTDSQASYGAQNCGADWDEQAVRVAESYRSWSSMSTEELIEQLEFEGFSHSEAVYGANH